MNVVLAIVQCFFYEQLRCAFFFGRDSRPNRTQRFSKKASRHNHPWETPGIRHGHIHFSSSSNLALRKRRHPSHQQVETNDHASHDPEALRIIRAMEPEQNRKDNASEIAHGAHRAAEDAIGVRVDVWDEGEIGTVIAGVSEDKDKSGGGEGVIPVTSFQEKRHASDQPEHCGLVLWVEEADGDEEGAGDDADEENPAFLQPEIGGDVFVEEVADDAA
jgi:hypothetical protein